MKRRIKKKIDKRLGCKTYLKYRKELLQQIINKRIEELGDDTGQIMVHLVLSRKANYKTIHSLKIFTNCYPVAIKSSFEKEDKEINLDFNCTPMSVDNELFDTYMNHIKAMAHNAFN
ncbi:MAG: hypothetical protein NC548_15990 [Lachnospiraceae bacterium]|nr:hypothetical protein [Lachnospiraceae bacterium]